MPPESVCGTVAESVAQADLREQRSRARGSAARRTVCIAAQAIAEQDVVEHDEPGQQQVALRHVGERFGRLGAGQQPGQPAQQRGLADAAAAQQARRPAGRELERRDSPPPRRRKTIRAPRTERGGEATTTKSPVPTPALTGSGSRGRSFEPLSRGAAPPDEWTPLWEGGLTFTQVS